MVGWGGVGWGGVGWGGVGWGGVGWGRLGVKKGCSLFPQAQVVKALLLSDAKRSYESL